MYVSGVTSTHIISVDKNKKDITPKRQEESWKPKWQKTTHWKTIMILSVCCLLSLGFSAFSFMSLGRMSFLFLLTLMMRVQLTNNTLSLSIFTKLYMDIVCLKVGFFSVFSSLYKFLIYKITYFVCILKRT